MGTGGLEITAFKAVKCYQCGVELSWLMNKNQELEVMPCGKCVYEAEQKAVEETKEKAQEAMQTRFEAYD